MDAGVEPAREAVMPLAGPGATQPQRVEGAHSALMTRRILPGTCSHMDTSRLTSAGAPRVMGANKNQ
jgi:hypothetical protein